MFCFAQEKRGSSASTQGFPRAWAVWGPRSALGVAVWWAGTHQTTPGLAITASPAHRPVPRGMPKGRSEATELSCRWHALFEVCPGFHFMGTTHSPSQISASQGVAAISPTKSDAKSLEYSVSKPKNKEKFPRKENIQSGHLTLVHWNQQPNLSRFQTNQDSRAAQWMSQCRKQVLFPAANLSTLVLSGAAHIHSYPG